jgi:hypothetical protein
VTGSGAAAQVMSRELAEHGYYKQKGEVVKLATKFVAQVSMLASGDLLQARPRPPRPRRAEPPRPSASVAPGCSTRGSKNGWQRRRPGALDYHPGRRPGRSRGRRRRRRAPRPVHAYLSRR